MQTRRFVAPFEGLNRQVTELQSGANIWAQHWLSKYKYIVHLRQRH